MLAGLCRKLWRDERGATAIEMGLLALPFLVLLFGTLEVSLAFAGSVILEGASAEAARLIRTGQVQNAAEPETAFKTELCEKASGLIDCARLQYEVIRVAANTFAGAENLQPTFDANGRLVPSAFSTGNSNDVVLIRTVYNYEFLTPFLGYVLHGDHDHDSVTFMTTVVVKAEPYNFGEE